MCFINAFQLRKRVPQALKSAFFQALDGTAKAVPYPEPIYETRSTLLQALYNTVSWNSDNGNAGKNGVE